MLEKYNLMTEEEINAVEDPDYDCSKLDYINNLYNAKNKNKDLYDMFNSLENECKKYLYKLLINVLTPEINTFSRKLLKLLKLDSMTSKYMQDSNCCYPNPSLQPSKFQLFINDMDNIDSEHTCLKAKILDTMNIVSNLENMRYIEKQKEEKEQEEQEKQEKLLVHKNNLEKKELLLKNQELLLKNREVLRDQKQKLEKYFIDYPELKVNKIYNNIDDLKTQVNQLFTSEKLSNNISKCHELYGNIIDLFHIEHQIYKNMIDVHYNKKLMIVH